MILVKPVCVYMFQVAGRLHVEVMRVAGGVEDSMAGGEDWDSSLEGEPFERKLVCMVGNGIKENVCVLHSLQ